jgi:hypothetical protein
MKNMVVGVLIFLLGLIGGIGFIVNSISFGIHCGGRMERAANANSITLALQEMEVVVGYLEKHELTKGNTAILWETPDQDLGFFYKNMKDSLTELRSIKEDATPLEKSNVLMKLRESLTNHSQGSTGVTAPFGISFSPYNRLIAMLATFCIFMLIIGAMFFMAGLDE